MPASSQPSGTQRDRFIVVLGGVVVGYIAGRLLEDRFAWPQARYFTMALGGVLAGVLARFTMARFLPPDESDDKRRIQ